MQGLSQSGSLGDDVLRHRFADGDRLGGPFSLVGLSAFEVGVMDRAVTFLAGVGLGVMIVSTSVMAGYGWDAANVDGQLQTRFHMLELRVAMLEKKVNP